LNRDDGPAKICGWFGDTIEYWYKFGKLHRENDLPAIDEDYRQEWWYEDIRHRENDLPAVIYYNDELHNNDKEWWYNGELHRIGAPAIITLYTEEWFYEGYRHCLSKPAYIFKDEVDFIKRYFIYDEEYNELDFFKYVRLAKKFVKKIKERLRKKLCQNLLKIKMLNNDVIQLISFYTI